MTEITKNGATKVSMEVRSSDELKKTIDDMISFMQHVKEWGFENTTTAVGKTAIGVAPTITNLLDGIDFDDFNIDNLANFQTFVRVVGLDDYSYYTIAEYAYMYTQVLENI